VTLASALRIAIQIAVLTTGLATGLSTTTQELTYLRRHPSLAARALLTTMVVTPLVAIGLWRVLPIGPAAAIAIVAGALAPGLPTLPKAGRTAGGNTAFAVSLLFTTSALAVVTVPLWLEVVRRVGGITFEVPIASIAKLLVVGLLLPLIVGAAIRRFAPTVAERMAGPVAAIGTAILPGLALLILLLGTDELLQMSWLALLAMVLVTLIALAVGHALGGPRPADRTILAIANAARFPALGALIAAMCFPEVRALPALFAYVLVANGLALPYRLARRRAHAHAADEEPAVAAPSTPASRPLVVESHGTSWTAEPHPRPR
jgi:BASS family bile acid:Na+ symporter